MPQFSTETLSKVHEIIGRYPAGQQKSALIPVLHYAQRELGGGWLPTEVMDYVAHLLQIKPIEVYEVATFYSMYNLKPVGRFVLEICRTGPCCLVGAERIQDHIEHTLGIKEGETTTDGMFTLKTMECLGACGYGPVLQILEQFHQNLTEEKVDALIASCRQKAALMN
ncbi:MAG: NAD(P)H-dependent oxidoreductase subunit E [Chitinophagales bacterium]|jgi:NADH-quinone oxidoreductase subunit E|nr:NAD(P)H-dependent oxidoreductase subunit E [Chitinophagales bacterium]